MKIINGRPRVIPSIIDNSTSILGKGMSTACFVGTSLIGPVNEVTPVTSIDAFIGIFGSPTPTNFLHYQVMLYLENSSLAYVTRVVSADAFNSGVIINIAGSSSADEVISAGISDAAVKEGNFDFATHTDALFLITSANAGVWGDNLSVRVVAVDTTENTFELAVYKLTDGVDVEVESFQVSRGLKLDGFGNQMKMDEVINSTSDYIRVIDNTIQAESVLPDEIVDPVSISRLTKGANGSAPIESDYSLAYDLYANSDTVDATLYPSMGKDTLTSAIISKKILAITESRGDAFAILDVPSTNQGASDIVAYKNTVLSTDTSYGALYTGWIKVFDQYNGGIVVTIPSSGLVAGIFAKIEAEFSPWEPVYGLEKGVLKSSIFPIVGTTQEYSAQDQDLLANNQINVIKSETGRGSYINFDSTLQKKSSYLQYINVRRLTSYIVASASPILRYSISKLNDGVTRTQVQSQVAELMATIRGGRGVEDYEVICNESNNPPEIINQGALKITVKYKPTLSTRYIILELQINKAGAITTA